MSIVQAMHCTLVPNIHENKDMLTYKTCKPSKDLNSLNQSWGIGEQRRWCTRGRTFFFLPTLLKVATTTNDSVIPAHVSVQ